MQWLHGGSHAVLELWVKITNVNILRNIKCKSIKDGSLYIYLYVYTEKNRRPPRNTLALPSIVVVGGAYVPPNSLQVIIIMQFLY